MATVVGSTLGANFNYETLDGAYIAEEVVNVAALASGNNTVNLPGNIVGTPLWIALGLCPDGVVLLIESVASITPTFDATHPTYSASATYAVNKLVTYNGTVYISLQDSNSGHTPAGGLTDAYWMAAGTPMTQVVINAANTAAGGCTLTVKVGTN